MLKSTKKRSKSATGIPISQPQKTENCADTKTPPADLDANAWQKGKVVQIQRLMLLNIENGKSAPPSDSEKEKTESSTKQY